MELRGFDYVADKPLAHSGLAGVATLIKQARAQAKAAGVGSILLDNGDFLQGNALGTWLAEQPVDETHALVKTLNCLGYDAIGLGNHDLDHGLHYLLNVAKHLKMPVIASNLEGADLSPLVKSALIPFPSAPQEHSVDGPTIGLLSVLPQDTTRWNATALRGKAQVCATETALRAAIPDLRAKGADVIVVLAHLGIGQTGKTSDSNAVALAHIEGVDALITGHTHLRFPGTDHSDEQGVDAALGTLAGRPAIMAGYAGSDLAIMDLSLQQSPESGSWSVVSHNSVLALNTADTVADPTVLRQSAAAHRATRGALARQLGQTGTPLHNFFSLAQPTKTAALHAQAKIAAAQQLLAKVPAAAGLPILATAAAHTSGGRGGAGNFLHIPKGVVRARHMAGLDPYRNQITAVVQTGTQLRARLEHSARVYALLQQGRPDQSLRNPHIPSYDFDTIFGLHYLIDPCAPENHRIKNLSYLGQPIAPDQRFALVTNQFRVAGGGGFAPIPSRDILLAQPISLHDTLTDLLAKPPSNWQLDATPWQFQTAFPVRCILETAPEAAEHLNDIPHLSPESMGRTSDGFLRLGLTL